MSSPSCSISASNSPQLTPPSSSPPLQWSSPASTEDRIPLAQRQVARRPPSRGCSAAGQVPPRDRQVAAGPSSFIRLPKESPEFTASILSAQEVLDLGLRYRVPKDIKLFRSFPVDRVVSSQPGRVALYSAFFKAGLRLPLHPFIVNLLDRYRLVPAQLVPNSIRTVVGFIVLCHFNGIEASLFLFRAFYTLRKQSEWWSFAPRPNRFLRLYLPTSVKGWKDRFFFADLK